MNCKIVSGLVKITQSFHHNSLAREVLLVKQGCKERYSRRHFTKSFLDLAECYKANLDGR